MGKSLKTRLRPVDVARAGGVSTQAVRNYEEAGILPPAERTASGYRVYTPRHVEALRVFAALVPAHGHATAAGILRAVHNGAIPQALALIDESHAELSRDRQTLDLVARALPATFQTSGRPMFIGRLAHQLRLRPATLRKWEAAGLVAPRRDRGTGYRVYSPDDVRDARLAHQLRRGGYGLARIREVIAQVRAAEGVEPLRAMMSEWEGRLSARGRAMLGAAGALGKYLEG